MELLSTRDIKTANGVDCFAFAVPSPFVLVLVSYGDLPVLFYMDGFVMMSVYSEPVRVVILLLLVHLRHRFLLNSPLYFSRDLRTNAFNMINVKRTLFC